MKSLLALVAVVLIGGTTNLLASEAEDSMARGRTAAALGTEVGLKKAVDEFRTSFTMSPAPADAFIEAADAQSVLASLYWRQSKQNILGLLSARALPDAKAITGLYQNSLQWAQKGEELAPTRADPIAIQALIVQNLGNSSEALKLANAAMTKDSSNWRAIYVHLGLAKLDAKEAELERRKLVDLLKPLVAQHPNDSRLHYILGEQYYLLNDSLQARKEAQSALNSSPGYFDACALLSDTFPWYTVYTPWKKVALFASTMTTSTDDPVLFKYYIIAAPVAFLFLANILLLWLIVPARKFFAILFFLWTIPLYMLTQYYALSRFSEFLTYLNSYAAFACYGYALLVLLRLIRSGAVERRGFMRSATEWLVDPPAVFLGNVKAACIVVILELVLLGQFFGLLFPKLMLFGRGPWT